MPPVGYKWSFICCLQRAAQPGWRACRRQTGRGEIRRRQSWVRRDRTLGSGSLGGGQGRGADHAQGASFGRRDACEHLQRHARGGGECAGGLHARARAPQRL